MPVALAVEFRQQIEILFPILNSPESLADTVGDPGIILLSAAIPRNVNVSADQPAGRKAASTSSAWSPRRGSTRIRLKTAGWLDGS